MREALAMRRPGQIVARSFSAAAARPAPHGRASPPPAVATNQPAPAYRQHHDVAAPQVDSTAFRQGWRVCSRLDSLLEAGAITRDAWDAAHTWRRWVEKTTPLRSQPWDVRVDRSLTTNDSVMLHRVTAATKLRGAAQALGELRMRLLELHVIRDASWRESRGPGWRFRQDGEGHGDRGPRSAGRSLRRPRRRHATSLALSHRPGRQ